jgi:hypothetical protein
MLSFTRRISTAKSTIIALRRRYVTARDSDHTLRANIKGMGAILGDIIKADDPATFETVEKLRKLGQY